jgi:sulfatase maturation enzyme AslB (radical SAM superfamily)
MCSSEFSSSWVRLDKEAVEQGLEFRNFTSKYQKVSRLDSDTLDLVYAQIHEAELIIVKGGEPTREPLLFDFLKNIKEKNLRKDLRLFIQTNGTRDFDEWKEHLSGFDLEIGFSIDGWGEVNDWIRSTRFEDVIQNLRKVHDSELVKEISIDFTLSSFNCFHLPVFLKKIVELSLELPKIRTCPVFQWVQQYYASPLALSASVRSKIADEIEPILNEHGQLFLNHENLLKILRLPRLRPELIEQAQKWTSFMGRKRGVSLFDLEPRLAAAMAFDQNNEIQK